MRWVFFAFAAAGILAILVMAHLYVERRQRLMFVKDLSPDELERLRDFERVQGNWREFRDRMQRR
jgi:hypothetical protein